MSKTIPMKRAAKTWSAIAMIGLAALPALASITAGAGAALAGKINTDVDHTGLLRIGFNEKLPATRLRALGWNSTKASSRSTSV